MNSDFSASIYDRIKSQEFEDFESKFPCHCRSL